ncbi:trypsin-like, partial [Leucoraja erinacea]|uniref:trypsin-like n=1 Tax=Leucoraja erinaceus TaxID=7782 RepID=UPI002455901A
MRVDLVFRSVCRRRHVRLGERDMTATGGSDQLIDAEMVIRHPKYDYYTRDNDIMLIKLSRPAAMNRNVVAVPLPTHCAQTGHMCLISAWSRNWSPRETPGLVGE